MYEAWEEALGSGLRAAGCGLRAAGCIAEDVDRISDGTSLRGGAKGAKQSGRCAGVSGKVCKRPVSLQLHPSRKDE